MGECRKAFAMLATGPSSTLTPEPGRATFG